MKTIKVIELFAGVGGFRLGLEEYDKDIWDFIFTNQWEPSKKLQHAFNCYVKNFGSKNAINQDIATVKDQIPKDADLLVAGFPCQDYSVAVIRARGIEGKKGVLWWEISWILENKRPKMVLLENVDRLLKSPTSQKGRDFAIMLFNMNKLGYDVEWQVINAADFGLQQRRKRVFIFARLRENFPSPKIDSTNYNFTEINKNSLFGEVFPVIEKNSHPLTKVSDFCLEMKDEIDVTKNYSGGKFPSKGFLINGRLYQYETEVNKSLIGECKVLKDILQDNSEVDSRYFLNDSQLEKIKEMKESKRKKRIKPNGEIYTWAEGRMSLYDDIDKPGRTMLTSESSIGRSTHVIKVSEEKYRLITPIEAERLNGFPDNWTASINSEKMRYFCMGNALVVDIIKKLAPNIEKMAKEYLDKD